MVFARAVSGWGDAPPSCISCIICDCVSRIFACHAGTLAPDCCWFAAALRAACLPVSFKTASLAASVSSCRSSDSLRNVAINVTAKRTLTTFAQNPARCDRVRRDCRTSSAYVLHNVIHPEIINEEGNIVSGVRNCWISPALTTVTVKRLSPVRSLRFMQAE